MRTGVWERWMGRSGSGRLGWRWIAVAMLLGIVAAGSTAQEAVRRAGPGVLGVESAAKARTRRFLRDRTTRDGGSPAFALKSSHTAHRDGVAKPRGKNLSAAWTAVGPAQVANPVYGSVTGRVTAIVVDPADATGNTVYVGTTGGGVWKSTNAAGPAGAVSFVALTDTLPVFDLSAGSSATPSLSIGALAIGNGVLLAGTGDPNDATDSYYGGGILRSADGGLTWTLAQESMDGVNGNHSFAGLSVAGLAFSSSTPNVVVAALSEAVEGATVDAGTTNNALVGLYVSNDAGVTWQFATVMDGAQVVQQATPYAGNESPAVAVVWNAVRQRFYAAVRYHGYYESADGATWTRLAHQPGAGLTLAACPTLQANAASCPLFRGSLAVQDATGDMFALTTDGANLDRGLYQDVCGLASGSCGSATVMFGSQLNSAALEVGSGSTEILQADYDQALAAVASGADTLVYVGTMDLYRCSVAGGCVLRNTTNAANGCATPAGVAGAQHAIAAVGSLVFVGNDGGLWRSTDGVAETGGVCAGTDAGHFDNLNDALGSLAEVVSFAQDPVDPGTLLAGLGALGSAGTSSATGAWTQMATGEGGTVAIDPEDSLNWYVATGPGVNIATCGKGAECGLSDFGVTVIGATQVAGDEADVHAPWLLDPQASSQMVVGTCRTWRGPASGGAAWTGGDLLSGPYAAPKASGCSGTFDVVASLGAGGVVSATGNSPNVGSTVLFAGMAGGYGGSGVEGHMFTTSSGESDSSGTAWADAALAPVSNAAADGYIFNPGHFTVSSVAVDPHDATGATVYVTVMGFAGNGTDAPHVYRTADGGAHWLNISANLPNAPANSILVDPNDANTLYVALDTGVYVTSSVTSCASSNCWDVYGTALPNAPVTSLMAAAGMQTGDGRTGELRAGTYGRGIWQIPLLTAVLPAQAGISLNPTAVTFPSQQVGTQSKSVTITVTNTGNATLVVTNVVASNDFVESDTCVGTPVAPAASCNVAVAFAPTAVGARTGVLTVYGNVTGGQATASLSGTGDAPASIVLTPTTLAFPTTTVGSTTAAENITISNTGGTAAGVQSIAVAGDFSISANSCGGSLAPGTGCTVSLKFAPTASGTRNGSLTVMDDAGTLVAQLSGIGTSPATDALTPTALTFAAQQLNTASAALQVTLTNTGDEALTLIAAQVSGDFRVVSGCGASLSGHGSCAFSVSYVPKSVGGETGILTVADEFRTQTVALSGTGLAPPGVSISPVGGISFAATAVGQQSTTETVTLTNNGGVALGLHGVTATGDFAVGGNTCAASLGAGTSCTVQVSFAPSVAGARSGGLSFADDAVGSPQTLALSGVGVDFMLAADGPVKMTVASGQTATYLLLLSSAAGVPGNAVLTCSGVPVASSCTVTPAATPLYAANGTVVTVTVATGQAKAMLDEPKMPWRRQLAWLAVALPVGVLFRRRHGGMLLIFFVVLTLGGCGSVGRTIPGSGGSGGGGSNPPPLTPSGTYTLVVAGSSTGLVREVDLTLVVQ